MPIPVVDVFAGPGGLGEGFASVRAQGRSTYDVLLSVEKDETAHRTLTLRKVIREVGARGVSRVVDHMTAGRSADSVLDDFPAAAQQARLRALRIELGPGTQLASERIRKELSGEDAWVLIGGPPCQAYSLAGRARNRGVAGYVADEDRRQTLYVEYLQLLADCEPAIFVMENVKGLLSATLNSSGLFDRIVTDLSSPRAALKREGRASRGAPRYTLYAVTEAGLVASQQPSDYVVRAENFGIPQCRHRVILVGVRDGGATPVHVPRRHRPTATVGGALAGLPRLRSGISRGPDHPADWRALLDGVHNRPWVNSVRDIRIRDQIRRSAARVSIPRGGRGAEAVMTDNGPRFNHFARSHMAADLERYFFAASFAAIQGRSPLLSDFPDQLLPSHRNVERTMQGGLFSDRFRVQVKHRPATTVTSHISKDGHYYIHHDATQCRSLTVREAARLQTFPDDYIFCGPRTAQYHQVGNAVPPDLARQIAAFVAELL